MTIQLLIDDLLKDESEFLTEESLENGSLLTNFSREAAIPSTLEEFIESDLNSFTEMFSPDWLTTEGLESSAIESSTELIQESFPRQEEGLTSSVTTNRFSLQEATDVITVTNTEDSGDGSLREAIDQANASDTIDTITFDDSLSGDTITLDDQLLITNDLTIEGLGQDELTIDRNSNAGDNSRVLAILDPDQFLDVTIDGLTITGGWEQGGNGGGILNNGRLTLSNSMVSGNTASQGAGIRTFNPIAFGKTGQSSLYLVNSTVSGNSASSHGGGISQGNRTVLTALNSTIAENTASNGGGIYGNTTDTSIIPINSTISGNSASGNGGGIYSKDEVHIFNSTIAENMAANGGGVYSRGSLHLANSILANDQGGDVSRIGFRENLTTVINTTTNGKNLVKDGSVPRTLALDPNLSPLQDNGGSTLTHLPQDNSPVINFGDNDAIPDGLEFDQRWEDRIVDENVDLGAIEVQDPNPRELPTFTVTNTEDSIEAIEGSLREAIAYANTTGEQETITFDESLAGETIELIDGVLPITESLTIEGLGADELTIDAQGNSGIFSISEEATDVEIEGIMLTNGGNQSAINNNSPNLKLTESVISNSRVSGSGAAISNGGVIEINQSVISDNYAGDDGGAIFNRDEGSRLVRRPSAGTAIINQSTIADNYAGNSGGGIFNYGSVEITESTISGNEATSSEILGGGGGIYQPFRGGVVNLENTTISGNSATGRDGGGIQSRAATKITLLNSTVTDNYASGLGGGIRVNDGSPRVSDGTLSLINSIVGNNTSLNGNNDIQGDGQINTYGNNLVEDGSVSGTINENPQLSNLDNHGGPTETHLPADNSPVINAGDNNVLPDDLDTDQRGDGFDRIVNDTVDLGAVEAGNPLPNPVFINTPLTFEIPDIANAETGDKVATLEIETPDENDLSFSLSGGDSTPFAIDNDGVLTIDDAEALEVREWEFLVEAKDEEGYSSEEPVTVEVESEQDIASVSGYIWQDLDGDGNWDEEELPLEGWTVYLDQEETGEKDEDDPYTLTDENGFYEFSNLSAGTYSINQIVPEGWEQTYPELESDSSNSTNLQSASEILSSPTTLLDTDYQTGEVIIKPQAETGTSELEKIKADLGAEVMSTIESLGLETWSIETSVEEAVKNYYDDEHLEYIEPNYTVSSDSMGFSESEPSLLDSNQPNDPRFDELWGLNNTGQSGGEPGADINALDAWDIETGSDEITVAVVDTGIDYEHPDLADNMWTNEEGEFGYDFVNDNSDPMDNDGHGTHVAGTIGAVGDNDEGITGVNWDVELMALKALPSQGGGSFIDLLRAFEYAIDNGADIINASLGGKIDLDDGTSQLVQEAKNILADGPLLIAAAGNDSSNNDEEFYYPANLDLDNVISVASTTHNDELSNFSNFGEETVHLGAPGGGDSRDILSTEPDGEYSFRAGTSMAAPHVAGVASLILSQSPDLSPTQVRDAILDTVDPIDGLENQTITGGRLNAFNALNELTVPGSHTVELEWDEEISDLNFGNNPLNDPPEITPIEEPFNILETTPEGTEVFTVEATDPDGDDEAITYSFTEGYPFAIDDDGVVTVADSEQLEADESFELEVVATNEFDLTSTETFTVDIDPNLPPEFEEETFTFEIAELGNASDGDEVETIGVSDPEGDDFTLSLPEEVSEFDLDNDGNLTIAAVEELELGEFDFTVEAEDEFGNSSEADVTVNLDSPPPEITPVEEASSILETVPDGDEVFTVEASDPDGNDDAITFSFTGDYPFAIDDDGVITVADTDQLEADDSFDLEVEATDELGASSTETFSVEVKEQDLNYDLTGNDEIQSAFDGALLFRYALGFTGEDLTQGLPLSNVEGAERTEASEIESYLEELNQAGALDITGNGEIQSAFDGALLFRYALGFTGEDLTQGLPLNNIEGAERTDAGEIESFLNDFSI